MQSQTFAYGILSLCKRQLLPFIKYLFCLQPELCAVNRHDILFLPSVPSQMRLYSGPKFLNSEGLRNIVVPAQAKSQYYILFCSLRRQKENRAVHPFTNFLTEGKSIHSRHHNIQKNQVISDQIHLRRLHRVRLRTNQITILFQRMSD